MSGLTTHREGGQKNKKQQTLHLGNKQSNMFTSAQAHATNQIPGVIYPPIHVTTDVLV